MGFLGRLFNRQGKLPDMDGPRILPLELEWQADMSMPVVDWKAAWRQAKARENDVAPRDFWWSAATAWLDALRLHLGDGFTIANSRHFTMLSNMPERTGRLTLESCERFRKRILHALDGVASSWGHGPHVVLVFDDIDQYYDYVGNYYPKEGTFAMSSGMFIQHGYGHFVFVASMLDAMESTIAHELTHCLLAPLPIPAWLNEGTAVNMEHQLVPHYVDPRHRSSVLKESVRERREFWNATTIQEFWSGKSYLRPDKGSGLSYDLGAELTRLIARDYDRYRTFMNAAHCDDAGAAAAESILGFTLGDLAGAVLGDGDWEPDPGAWAAGTEKGQF